MSRSTDDDLPAILARAFVQAWQSYYVPGRHDVISEEAARPALAKYLVAIAKEGINEEAILAAAGLRHLNSLANSLTNSLANSLALEPERPGALRPKRSDAGAKLPGEPMLFQSRSLGFHSDKSRARFLRQWRISWS